jgi:WD40 repeat protein
MTQPLGRDSRSQDEFNDVIRQVAARTNSLLIDLDRAIANLDRSKYFYPDAIHFNNEGSVWAASIIADSLEKFAFRGANTTATNVPATPQEWPCGTPKREVGKHSGTQLNAIDFLGRYPSLDATGRLLLSQFNTDGASRIELRDLSTGETKSLVSAVAPMEVRHPILEMGREPKFVVYGARRGTYDTLHRFEFQSKQEKPLLPNSKLAMAIPTMGASGTIYFAGYSVDPNGRPSEAPDLFLLARGSSEPVRITRTPWEEWRPFVAPGEKVIYYISNRDGSFDIYRLSLESNAIAKVVGTEHDEWDPAVSPDGQWLAYSSRKSGNFDIYLLHLASQSVPLQITSSIEDEWDPRFSPDGQTLLYATTTPKGSRVRGTCLHSILGRR